MASNKRLDVRLENLPADIWSKIAKIDEQKGKWSGGAELNPQILGRLKKSVLVTSTGASTRIEGARLSDEAVEKLMKGLDIQKFTNRDKQEVRGYYELLKNVFRSWKNLRFSENTIKHFHKELLKYAERDQRHRGEYKKQENKVHMIDESGKSVGILFDTTSAYLTPKEMQELTEWTCDSLAEDKYHPLPVIGNFIAEFLKIHPFQDGNGRMSRILTNLLLLQSGYVYVPYVSHEKLIEDNKPEYYLALRRSQKTFYSPTGKKRKKKENLIPWLDFFLTINLTQSEMAVALLSDENIEKLLSAKQLAALRYLESVSQASPLDISKNAKIARPTVNQVLDRLLQFKKIERIGQGRSTNYKKID